MTRDVDVVIVGGGPRSTGLIAALGRLRSPVLQSVAVVDHLPDGAGVIWRDAQPPLLLANSPAGHIRGSARDASSFLAWCRSGAVPSPHRAEAASLRAESFPSRRLVGEYLRQDAAIVDEQSDGLDVRRVCAWVTSVTVTHAAQDLKVTVTGGRALTARVVLAATGSGQAAPEALPPGRHVAAVPLEEIPAGAPVWVRGLGLTFHDVLSVLTEHRGGRYLQDGRDWVYRASGREPRIVASSRSGTPIAPKVVGTADLAPVALDQRAASAFLDESAPLTGVILGEIRRRLSERGLDTAVLRAVPEPDGPVRARAALRAFDAPAYVARWARSSQHAESVVTSAVVVRTLREFAELAPTLSARQLRAVEHVASRLTSGPPPQRFRQLDALVRAGIVAFGPPPIEEKTRTASPCAWTVRAYAGAPKPPFDIVTDAGRGWPVDGDGRVLVDPAGNRCTGIGSARHHLSMLGQASSFPLSGGLPTAATGQRFRAECDTVVRSADKTLAEACGTDASRRR